MIDTAFRVKQVLVSSVCVFKKKPCLFLLFSNYEYVCMYVQVVLEARGIGTPGL